MISDERFKKAEHLLKTKDFMAVYKKGARAGAGWVILYYLPNAIAFNRIGFSISSRNIGLATRRNRIRRLFREAFRNKKKDFKKGFDIVLVIKKDPGRQASYKEIEDIFIRLGKGARALL